jgi:ATP-binding cassette subfamily B protein
LKFKFFKQLDSNDCGVSCLKMIANYYGRSFTVDYLRRISFITKEGVSLLTISKAAERIGFKTLNLELSFEYLADSVPLPCILFYNKQHFVVLYDIKESRKRGSVTKLCLADPGIGLVNIDYHSFMQGWADINSQRGIVLVLEPLQEFYQNDPTADEPAALAKRANGFLFLGKYFLKYKKFFLQLLVGLLGGSLLSLIFPFLTQSMVDYGIGHEQIDFIILILLFQLALFMGNTIIDFIRSHLLLHIGTRINISIVSDFLIKLMKLPLMFFESKRTGDIMQRIEDHKRIEVFITQNVLNTFFSIVNLVVMIFVIAVYNVKILVIFLIGSLFSVGWNMIFMSKVKTNDYRLFNFFARNRDDLYEIIKGIEEIKLNDFEIHRRWKWEITQFGLFKLNTKVLQLRQYQRIGSTFFIQLMNIMVTYISAREVVNHHISLGIMLTIASLIGQMISPIEQLSSFFNAAQQAKISLERLNEVHNQLNEEDNSKIIPEETFFKPGTAATVNSSGHLALYESSEKGPGIQFRDLSFRYEGPGSPYVLKAINLHIPFGKTTAIVGSSGSGKTTLLKLLLKFYEPEVGQILINGQNLNDISAKWWRRKCGVVMQEGYIFSDTIRKNISTGDEFESEEKLWHAARVANIEQFIHSNPLQLETKIGDAGSGLSTGQKQRLLIARAVYKDPEIFLFDEATSSLDSKNEREIVTRLREAVTGRTMIIIAHRLSTVRNADKIVVLEDGEIVEEGDHAGLINSKGRYFTLVKNQLELDG